MKFKKSSDFYLISADTRNKQEISRKKHVFFTRNDSNVKFWQIRMSTISWFQSVSSKLNEWAKNKLLDKKGTKFLQENFFF